MSILLRPVDLPVARWHLLTAAAGLAARRACQQVGGFSPDLKWPNDLLVGDRKLAGILAEAAEGAGRDRDGLQCPPGPAGAAWVDEAAGRRVDRSDLLGAWLAALDDLPRSLGRGGGRLPGRLLDHRPNGHRRAGPSRAPCIGPGRGHRRRGPAGRSAGRGPGGGRIGR